MSEKHILFTGVGRRIELLQAFRSAALVLHKKIKIYGADMAGTAPALAYCDFTRRVVAIKDPTYIDSLLDICRKDKIDLLIPTIDTDLLILSENRERFEAIGTKIMIAAPDKIRICRDKNLTSQFFADCGLKAPMPVSDWTTYSGGFPAFIKPKDGSSSIDAYKVSNEEELKVLADQIDDYVIQPYIDGREYTIDVFCDWEGVPVSIVPRERLQVRAGEVLKTKITMDPVMIKETEELCRAFQPCGALTVQLIRDEQTGEDHFIEINPRFGGGSPLSMKAGARSAEEVLKLLDGEEVERFSDIADGAVYSRFDQSVCIMEGPGEIKGVIFDLDDTLYSEKEYVRSGFRAVADWLGDAGYANQLWQYFEEGKPAIDCLLKDLGREQDSEQALTVYRMHDPDIHLFEGVKKLLVLLREKGMKIGIITDGAQERQMKKVEALGLGEMIDDIVVTDGLGGLQFRKPCDIAFRMMQTKWKLPPSEMVYIGDNPAKDFQAPQQLGMRSVWVRNKNSLYYTPTDSDYFRTVDDITELRHLFG